MVTLIFLRGLCGYICVNILTLSPLRCTDTRTALNKVICTTKPTAFCEWVANYILLCRYAFLPHQNGNYKPSYFSLESFLNCCIFDHRKLSMYLDVKHQQQQQEQEEYTKHITSKQANNISLQAWMESFSTIP